MYIRCTKLPTQGDTQHPEEPKTKTLTKQRYIACVQLPKELIEDLPAGQLDKNLQLRENNFLNISPPSHVLLI